jgi:excisionase family DNA binding protein
MPGGYTQWQPLLITVDEAAQMLSMGRTKLYDLIRYEGFPVVRFGKMVRIRPSDLQEWLEKREEQEAAE